MIGVDAHTLHDGAGKDLGELFDQTLTQGQGKGFAAYVWEKPGYDSPQPKISYLSTSPGWHWILGTGIYLDDVNAAFYAQIRQLLIEVALALVLLLALGGTVTRRILRQLGAEPQVTTDVVKRIASGQLNESVTLAPGDNSSLLAAVAHMQEELRQLVHKIIDSANQLGQMSSQVTRNAQGVAQSSAQQSQAASSMAGSVEQMTGSIHSIADHAEEARRLSQVSGEL